MRNQQVKELEIIFLELRKKDKNINGIGIGQKVTREVETEQEALIIYVNEKLDRDKIEPDKVIPSSILYNNTTVITDVVGAKHTTCPSCYADADNLLPPSSPTSPIYNNRANLSILSGGCNFAKWTPANISTFCTLGGIFKDNMDNSYVGLTNRHCVDRMLPITINYLNKFNSNDSYLATEYYTLPFLNFYGYTNFQSEFSKTVTTYEGFSVNFVDTVQNYNMRNTHYYQPSRFTQSQGIPNSDSLSGNNCIGFFKRAVPVLPYNDTTKNFFNYVDGALIAITNKINSSSKRQIGFNFNGTIQAATDAEIDLVINNKLPLFYSGSRSGPVGSPGSSAPCTLQVSANIRIFETKGSIKFKDSNFGDAVLYYFSDCIEFKSNTSVALLEGDSGSIIWGQLPTGWKIIGLNFANTTYTTGEVRGLFCRITNVFKALNIDVWNGETLNFSNQTHEVVLPSQLNFTKVAGNSVEVVNDIEIDGKKYYYAGMTNTSTYNNLNYQL